jgi:Protein of unknown function (DUF1264)
VIRLFTLLGLVVLSFGCRRTAPVAPAEGESDRLSVKAINPSETRLQNTVPLKGFDTYLNGFHSLKENPSAQEETHSYCNQMNEDFAQCVLFDGDRRESKMTGVEYVISEKLFLTLPNDEKKYWHSNNYEILSGQLVTPGMPDAAEKSLLRKKMNTYSKTWQMWTVEAGGKVEGKLPLGEPRLAWSFSQDGELQPDLLSRRDKEVGVMTAHKKQIREDLAPLVHPR